ncbi:MAG: exodeoxyribonuclease VII large subunit [Bacilli bacterium]|nr:exodeoxyribonuclease VII large subunit [Bacilli bacterium]MDD4584864.1 exodeoxyribonuclease VII large subunit [Bacilli bacterium]
MNNPISVSLINRYIKDVLEKDYKLRNLSIIGEISNLKMHQSGHWYFTLKDEFSRISAVMFSSYASKVRIKIQEGMKVIVSANIGLYEQGGTYQLYVTEIIPQGVGSLYVEFEKLKKKLFDEGLFDDSNKVKIPRFCQKIGIVTAPKGAAVKDIITTIKRRWPIAELVLIPSLVQGEGAAFSIVEALDIADKLNFDVIICGRGGGSIEDLWPFNEEIVARKIYSMKTPIVSAVGHEVDYTISDFVADLRAPTPTAAAEIVTPNQLEFSQLLLQIEKNLVSTFYGKIDLMTKNVQNIRKINVLNNIDSLYSNKRMYLDNIQISILKLKEIFFNKLNSSLKEKQIILNNNFFTIYRNKNHFLENYASKIDLLSPLKIFKRGYAKVSINDAIVTSVKNICKDDILMITFNDGSVESKVVSKKEGQKYGEKDF